MLSRIWRFLFGGREPTPESTVKPDRVGLQVMREQRHIAKRLARLTGKRPEELLDYRRADHLWARKR